MPAPPLPLVLLQAPPGVEAPLRALRQGFASRRPVVDWPCPSPTDESKPADLPAALAALGAPGTIVVAWSLGAPFALDLAQRHPDLVRAWVLVSPTWGPEGRAAWRAAILGAAAWRFVGHAARATLEKSGVQRTPGPSLAARLLRGSHLLARATPTAAIQQALAEIAAVDPTRLEGVLRQIGEAAMTPRGDTPPLLVLTGERDRVCPPRRARRLAEAFPGAEIHVARDGSHGLPLEYPEWVALRTEKYLRDRSIS